MSNPVDNLNIDDNTKELIKANLISKFGFMWETMYNNIEEIDVDEREIKIKYYGYTIY